MERQRYNAHFTSSRWIWTWLLSIETVHLWEDVCYWHLILSFVKEIIEMQLPLPSSRTPTVKSCIQKRFQWTSTYHNKLNNVEKLPSVLSGNFFLFANGGDLHSTSYYLPLRDAARNQKTHTHYSSFGELVCHYQVIAQWTYQKHLTLCIEIPVRFQIQSYDVLTCTDSSTPVWICHDWLCRHYFICLRLYVTHQSVH